MFCSHVPAPLHPIRAHSPRGTAAAIRFVPRLTALAIATLLLSSAAAAQAQPSPPTRDSYARIIARADAVVLGRVLEVGIREVPDHPGSDGRQLVTRQAFARIAVQRWILGPDTDPTLEVRLDPYGSQAEVLLQEASQSARLVILYLVRSRGEWWLVREVTRRPGKPLEGIEALLSGEALNRIPAILHEAAASSPDSLAARADLAVVCSLDRLTDDPPGIICLVERVVFGTPTDSVLTVVTQTPGDLGRGEALLLLAARPDSKWEVLDDGAGCYYLYHDRVAHSPAPLEAVFSRVAAAHARRTKGLAR
jgi:hypothetical protein